MAEIIEDRIQKKPFITKTRRHENTKEEGAAWNNRSFFVLSSFRAFVMGFDPIS